MRVGVVLGLFLLFGLTVFWLAGKSNKPQVDPTNASRSAMQGPTHSEESAPPPPTPPQGDLNPNDFPELSMCAAIPLKDQVGEAKANIEKGDLRPFATYGFFASDVPGVYCPAGNYNLERRAGTFVSDMPDACGG